MKFTIVVVMLALAFGAQASVLPWGLGLGVGHGLSYTAVSGPAVLPAAVDITGHGLGWDVGHGLGLGLGHGLGLGLAAVVAAAPAVVAAPIAHEGQYVAKTRGAVHTAPLTGHLNSAASINLAPAPGTI